MNISFAIHIFGLVFWMGPLILLPALLKSGANGEGVQQYVNRSKKGFMIPGLFMVLLSGVYQIVVGGVSTYMSQGWFHGKLTLVLFLFVLTWLLWRELGKFQKGVELSRPLLILVHAGASTSLLLIALLTFRVLL